MVYCREIYLQPVLPQRTAAVVMELKDKLNRLSDIGIVYIFYLDFIFCCLFILLKKTYKDKIS